MTRYDARLPALLGEIEGEMRELGYWSDTRPPAAALRSRLPFCYDTLHFLQWVQWVMLPRMHQVVAEGQALPARCAILPAAEVYFDRNGLAHGALLDLFARVDAMVSDSV